MKTTAQAEVSVVIPLYNAEKSIARAIDSALRQDPSPHEIIVVNDGSTDSSSEIARSYGAPVIVIDKVNGGPSAARNVGMHHATGEFIAFLDADDYWLDGFIAATVTYLKNHDDSIAVSTGWRQLLLGGATVEFPGTQIIPDLQTDCPTELENFFEFWAEHFHVVTGSVMFRRSALDGINGQLETLRMAEDYEFWATLATMGKWGFIPSIFWVGDSAIMAAKAGWTSHFKTRRQLCSTVDEWQHRLLSRGAADIKGFYKIRGRVACGYAHAHILSGRNYVALSIVRQYGDDFAHDRMSKWMKHAAGMGSFAWIIVCFLIRVKEISKSMQASWYSFRAKS